MPVNRRWGVDRVIEACDRYFEKTGRRISYEYALISGVNDTKEHAKELSEKLKGKNAHVNLISLNNVEGGPFSSSTGAASKAFMDILGQNGIRATFRKSMGNDIDAACGQLRRKGAGELL